MGLEGITILTFVIASLLIGSLLRAMMRRSSLPYTVVLLLLGLGLAGLARAGWLGTVPLVEILELLAALDPHFILFLFLPTLIFESAYTMEPHLFMRIAPQITLLAVLGLIISMLLSALAISFLLPWGIGVALLFGALISATDPVAVVALLKEKSSRKRLETLIEGESLLNDGIAIVFFSLFYGFALGTVTTVHPWSVVGEFVLVVVGGLVIGVVVGWLTLFLIGRLLNQPLIEITLSVTAAYVTYLVAEQLHVSGVVALVALALMFSTLGRTRISPEVSHFLHQFWEMMAYLANTLIFLIVGIVIAMSVSLDSPLLWIVLALLYPLLMLIRAVTVWSLMPLLKRIGIGITRQKATVLIWGGLRGAVSLALALSLAQDKALPAPLGEQILFLTAGIVVLTIVINGSTMEWLLHILKLDQLPLAKEASVQKARIRIQEEMSEFFKKLQGNPFFNTITRDCLRRLSDERREKISASPVRGAKAEELDVAFMRRLLEIERSHYWQQFEEGYIGRHAAFELSRSVERALDNQPCIAPRPGLNQVFTVPRPPEWLSHLPMMGGSMDDWVFSHLSLGYDVARGLVDAQEEMKSHVDSLSPGLEASQQVEAMIEQNISQALAFNRHLSEKYPELVNGLQAASARRVMLNHERSLIWKMKYEGVLEEAEAHHLIDHIENQMMAEVKEKGRG